MDQDRLGRASVQTSRSRVGYLVVPLGFSGVVRTKKNPS